MGGQSLTSPLGVIRMLKHQRALKVTGAVEPGCKLEVALEQRAGILKNREQVGIRVQFINFG
jgi:hypothetical protein